MLAITNSSEAAMYEAMNTPTWRILNIGLKRSESGMQAIKAGKFERNTTLTSNDS